MFSLLVLPDGNTSVCFFLPVFVIEHKEEGYKSSLCIWEELCLFIYIYLFIYLLFIPLLFVCFFFPTS